MSIIKWDMDRVHSEIQFKARHMVITTVTGQFDQFEATAETENDSIENAKIHFNADTVSVFTGVQQRDEHLRSDDFFNADKYPKLTFESTSFNKIKDDLYKLKGNLTIRDITKPIELDVEYGGEIKDPYGNRRAGFTVTGKVSRKDYGLRYNALLESGGAVVGDEIKINCHMEFIHHD